MHWAYETAQHLIDKYPNKAVYTCASGISPSGAVHIGNFREIITTYFVVRALQKMGKETRFIFSWDDYDRFRKVPKNIDSKYEQYIGLPYSRVPSPSEGSVSYASYFEKQLENSLVEFGIDVEFIYQHERYASKDYNEHIFHAISKRKQIYDVLSGFRSQQGDQRERDSFYPVAVYCTHCGKDSTTIKSYDEVKKTIQYTCLCGFEDTIEILNATSMKLNWKIDWPMRWMVEDVVFEPGGRDHSSATGSYNVSKVISERIFSRQAPEYEAYDFIGIKGSNEKMSSSSGNVITPADLLNIYTPEIILFIFAKYHPSKAFHIGVDGDIIRNYTEFERYVNAYRSGKPLDYKIKSAIELSMNQYDLNPAPSFSQLSSLLPLINFNHEILVDLVNKEKEFEIEAVYRISKRAEYWLKNYQAEKLPSVNHNKNHSYYNTLSMEQKNHVKEFNSIVKESAGLPNEQLMHRIYQICHHEDKKIKKSRQKDLFQTIYQLVLSQENGPRIPLLIEAIGKDKIIELTRFT